MEKRERERVEMKPFIDVVFFFSCGKLGRIQFDRSAEIMLLFFCGYIPQLIRLWVALLFYKTVDICTVGRIAQQLHEGMVAADADLESVHRIGVHVLRVRLFSTSHCKLGKRAHRLDCDVTRPRPTLLQATDALECY